MNIKHERDNRIHRGDMHKDGRMFWGYRPTCKNGEYWITPEKFDLWMRKEQQALEKKREGKLRRQGLLPRSKAAEYMKRYRDRIRLGLPSPRHNNKTVRQATVAQDSQLFDPFAHIANPALTSPQVLGV